MQYTADNLLVRPEQAPAEEGLVVDIPPAKAGWELIHFQARRLQTGDTWTGMTGGCEAVLVNLTGTYTVSTRQGKWTEVGGRANVFEAAAHALYLPRGTEFAIAADEGGEFAFAMVPSAEDHEPFLIRPEDVSVSIRGGGNVSRQINDLLPPGSPVHRLVLVEVYTPGGNWSSYPPHKHDVHVEGEGQGLTQADLEEIYFYKFDRPDGYAFQRVYTDERCPLHQAGTPIDAVVMPRENDTVLVPEGYHPVTSAPGYTAYYLNVLAGSAQALAAQDDPRYAWVKETYGPPDPRLPLY